MVEQTRGSAGITARFISDETFEELSGDDSILGVVSYVTKDAEPHTTLGQTISYE